MEEWKEYKLGDVLNFRRGHDLPKTAMKGGDIPVAGSNGIIGYHNEATPVSPCITIGRSGNVGTPFIYDKCWAHNTVLYVDDFKGNNPLYLFYLLKTLPLSSFGGGSAVPTLNRNHIHPLVIKHTSNLKTQQQIASILKSIDNKIEINRRINDNFPLSLLLLTCFILWLLKLRNDNLEQQAKTIFKSWLSNCQAEVTIGDLSLNITDYSKCNSLKVVLVNSSDVTNGFFDHHILSDNMNLKGHFKKRFKKGDILYSQVRPRNRHWAYCTFEADHYLASTQLMVIRNKKEILPSVLLYQYLIEDDVWNEFTLKTETRSGTFPQGNYEDLASIQVPFGAEMNNIIPELESLYSLKYSIEKESRLLSSLRDTLLPKLMSGKLKMNKLTV